jgi:hypothetical protein
LRRMQVNQRTPSFFSNLIIEHIFQRDMHICASRCCESNESMESVQR